MAVLSAVWSFNAHTMSSKKQTGEKHTLVLNYSFYPQFFLSPFLSFLLSLRFLISYNILSLLHPFHEFSNTLDDRAPTQLGNNAVHFENHKQHLL